MNNAMLAERQLDTTENQFMPETAPVSLRVSRPTSKRSKPKHGYGYFRNDWLTVAVLLVCTFALCLIGVIYVAAYARVSWQANQIASIDSSLASATAENDALVKQYAYLQSDHRIAPKAMAMKMSQSEPSTFIEAGPSQLSVTRQVASAL